MPKYKITLEPCDTFPTHTLSKERLKTHNKTEVFFVDANSRKEALIETLHEIKAEGRQVRTFLEETGEEVFFNDQSYSVLNAKI